MAELLAPAGSLEKMKFALYYGADAVYAGGSKFSLRTRAENFNFEDLAKGIDYTHKKGKKFYIAVNSFFMEDSIESLPDFLDRIAPLGPDALIISDLGAIRLVKKMYPDIPIHISTQANTTNSEAVSFYKDLGIDRIILAREVSLENIKKIKDKVKDIELEVFVHGAMCVAYSGRCLISNYFTSKSFLSSGESLLPSVKRTRVANEGDCSQCCRWHYSLVEEMRDGVALLAEEIPGGTMLFSSKDLSMIHHMNELYKAGIDSFKIEGRMKSLLYTANTTRIYKYAISAAQNNDIISEKMSAYLQNELDIVTRRETSSGFFFSSNEALHPSSKLNEPSIRFVGVVENNEGDYIKCRSYNKITSKDELNVIDPEIINPIDIDFELYNEDLEPVEYIGHSTVFYLKTNAELKSMDIIRMKI